MSVSGLATPDCLSREGSPGPSKMDTSWHIHPACKHLSFPTVGEQYGDVVSSQGVAQHLEIKSSSRPDSPFTIHPGGGVVVQSNHPTHVVVLQPTHQLTQGVYVHWGLESVCSSCEFVPNVSLESKGCFTTEAVKSVCATVLA